MDGYAVRSEETPGSSRSCSGSLPARPRRAPLAPGKAMAIATGGAVPEGADAVVPIEHVEERNDALNVPDAVQAGANVRPRGGYRRGKRDRARGHADRPRSDRRARGGRCGGRVVRAPSTGGGRDHGLRAPRARIDAGPGRDLRVERRDARGAAGCRRSRGRHAQVGGGRRGAHRDAIEQGLSLDVLVTSGGVSVGPHDLVRRVEQLGVEEVFWGVAVKPGKPVSFGVRGTRWCSACRAIPSRRSWRVRCSYCRPWRRYRERPTRARVWSGDDWRAR